MIEEPSASLSTLISAAVALLGSQGKAPQSSNLATVLKSRLIRVYEIVGQEARNIQDTDLERLQYLTAKEALRLVERIQTLLDPKDCNSSALENSSPLLGTRDLSHIRTLLSIVFRWSIVPLCAEFELTRPGFHATSSMDPQIINLTERKLDLEDLPLITTRLLALIFGPGLNGKIRQTWITTTILSHHPVDILTPCLLVGWFPNPISEKFSTNSKDIKMLAARFTSAVGPHEAIAALGTILSIITRKGSQFVYATKACTHLLSNQLKRPDGVRGLCTAVFSQDIEETEVAPLEKLERVAKILRTIPADAKPQPYYEFIIPRILDLLSPSSSDQTPSLHKRAAAFALSRMLSPTFQHHTIASNVLLPILHRPFLFAKTVTENINQTSSHSYINKGPLEALQTLQTFTLHADPSPIELSILLTPIIPELYTLLFLHRSSKTADPRTREGLSALLSTWGRIVSSSDAFNGLWSIVAGAGGNWTLVPNGFERSVDLLTSPSISLLAAAELESGSKEDVDILTNPFNLRPDPSEFVTFLRTLERKEVSSEVFIRLLNEYRELKEIDGNPMRTLLYLQLILQIQSQLSETILSKPEHVLSFIRHALESQVQPLSRYPPASTQKRGLGLKDLRIVKEEESDTSDSDDEDEPAQINDPQELGHSKNEMTITAITLLLSTLEGNADLSSCNTPDLNLILSFLEDLSSHTSPAIRQLAREARLVLTARTASTSSGPTPASRATPETETAQGTYQQALKLLQDPIIPVRAHGLQILRNLVSQLSTSGPAASGKKSQKPLLDPALIPGILSIFLQSIQDEESYIFLNAVQGLAAMVDGYGREMLQGVMDIYLSGTGIKASGRSSGTTSILKEELDARIRVGEALHVVVRRCGDALGLYVDILVPPLLGILRSSDLPIILRTSALSILAQCAETNVLALNKYSVGLADTCVELIQLESVAARSTPGKTKAREPPSVSSDATIEGDRKEDTQQTSREPELTDKDPTTSNPKAVPFRRSALHFLSQFLRAHIANLYHSQDTSSALPNVTLNVGESKLQIPIRRETTIPESVVRRATVVLDYVAATDGDTVTRVMAREAWELVQQYQQACIGL